MQSRTNEKEPLFKKNAWEAVSSKDSQIFKTRRWREFLGATWKDFSGKKGTGGLGKMRACSKYHRDVCWNGNGWFGEPRASSNDWSKQNWAILLIVS